MSPKTAAIRQQVTDMTLKYAYVKLDILRLMRQRMVADLREIQPTGRVYFAVSKLGNRTLDVTALIGEDDAYTLSLIQKLRTTRKQCHGFRTLFDEVEAMT